MSSPVLFWIVFNLLIAAILFLDLKVLHKKAHAMTTRESTAWFLFLVLLALAFDVGIYYVLGHDKALQFLTGYIIEESLSIDNLFVFLVIFNYFSVPAQYQPRVLHWGIMGAIVMRFIFIFLGSALVSAFHWMFYVFGGMLMITGIKTALGEEKKIEPEKNPVLLLLKKFLPIANREYVDEKFFVRLNAVIHATPLFVVLVLIESSDVVFAVDSIPAVLAISTDTLIVYTSNVFAILGLRALYFILNSIMPLFTYLKFGISIVLCFVGLKMLLIDFFHIPTLFSLGVVMGILGCSILFSVAMKPKNLESGGTP